MKASDIIKLLEQRHSKDLFVPECKDGPTGSHGMHVRLDAWVMPKSWANPALRGYEVKITHGGGRVSAQRRTFVDAVNAAMEKLQKRIGDKATETTTGVKLKLVE